jgi:hypothetical protein
LQLEAVGVSTLDVVSIEVAMGDGSSGKSASGVEWCGGMLGGGGRRGLSTAQCDVEESGGSEKFRY